MSKKLDILEVAAKIKSKIEELDKGCNLPLYEAAKEKAETKGNYSKVIAIAEMRLRAGKPAELGGETIKDPPATIMRDIAKGLCFQEEINMELADAEYKRVVEKLECLRAELNGWQSYNKYLEYAPNEH